MNQAVSNCTFAPVASLFACGAICYGEPIGIFTPVGKTSLMTIDPYAPCPCGSGKKFKWCCQPIYAGIQHAWEQESSGQHEHALQLIDEVVRQFPDNPEAWGQKALLLQSNDRLDDAEAALEKAFAINPNYPFGLRLRARFRYAEGEYLGALLLARRAVEVYDPGAHDDLAELFSLIFDGEMRCNRPVAARAALEQAARLDPANEGLSSGLEEVFGDNSRFPPAARRAYSFRKPAGATAGARRQVWNRALSGSVPRLGELAAVFASLTQEDASDAPAWFNLGLCRAWLGENAAALEAFDRYLDLEADEAAASEAATLIEVLRFGVGLEEQCDYHEYSLTYQISNPQPIQALLNDWMTQNRLVPIPSQEEGLFTAMVLELTTTGLVTVGRPASDAGRLAGYLVIVGPILRFHGPIKEAFDRVKDEMRQRLSLGLTDLHEHRGPAQFQEVVSEALLFPLGQVEREAAIARVLEHATRYLEETWIHRPRHSLNTIAPVDAAGHGKLRKKLLGVIELMAQCAQRGMLEGYDFDRLRRKLGLLGAAAPTATATADVSALGAADLAALDVATLSDDQLEKAYQAAYRLDAGELAGHFAEAIVARPVSPERPDRYPWYAYLVQRSLRDGQLDAALQLIDRGQQADSEGNGGNRHDDYELFRARAHAARGEVEPTEEVFRRLISRSPRNFKVRGKAAEQMLSLKQPARALAFAEEGIKAARQANDRDSEQYLLELAGAARKQGG